MKTGFKDLDNKIELNNGDLIIIASRPAMGKTTFVENIMNNVAIKQKKTVLFFSLDESKEAIIKKIIINNSSVESYKLELYEKKSENSKILEEDWDRITYSMDLLKDAPIYIADEAPYTIENICKKARKMKLNKDIELIIIDYVQLILFDKGKGLSRNEEMQEILKQLKILAKELNVPIIVTSQLSRNIEKRENKRPCIADFKNIGFLKYSDKILFIYRDSYYYEKLSNITEIIIAKNNTGDVDTIKLAWIPEYCKFGNIICLEEENKEDYKCNEKLDSYKTMKNADEIKNIELIPKEASYPKIKNSKEIIKETCYNRAHELYGKTLPKEVKERLELELNSIIDNDFETIYLIYSELVKYSNEMGYKVSSRGCVGNSLVACLLGITDIDPIYYNLPFEVFAGKDYDKKPDINLNFSSKIQTKILQYSQRKFGLYKLNILGHNDPTMLHELEKETNTDSNKIDLGDKKTLELFLHANDSAYPISMNGIPEFASDFVKNMIQIAKPKNFNDLVCISALSHGTDVWLHNALLLVEQEGKKVDEVISNRDDMFNYLLDNGIDRKLVYDIVEFVRKGRASKARSKSSFVFVDKDKYKEYNTKWNEYKKIMQEHNIPDWYINSAEKIKYMFPKAHSISYTTVAFKIAWYKVHYPKAFYKVYSGRNHKEE